MKKLRTPCEIVMWDIVPAIRRELAYVLVKEYELPQKSVAELLGISEAAVSQYIKRKRGKKVKFDKEELEKIREIAKGIAKKQNKASVIKSICKVCRDISYKKLKGVCML